MGNCLANIIMSFIFYISSCLGVLQEEEERRKNIFMPRAGGLRLPIDAAFR